MDIKRKLEIVDQDVRNITEHRDEDAALRLAALDRVIEIANNAKAQIQNEIAADIADKLNA